MKNYIGCFLLLIAFLNNSSINNSIEEEHFTKFKKEIDFFDKSIYNNNFKNEYALKWWNIYDDFILSVLNENKYDIVPIDYLFNLVKETSSIKIIDGILIRNYDEGSIEIHYNELRYSDELKKEFGHDNDGLFSQPISIVISPLNKEKSVCFITYKRDWNLKPNGISRNKAFSFGTFRIIEKNPINNKYEIKAKQEVSNFQKNIILTNKFRFYDGRIINQNGWVPSLIKCYKCQPKSLQKIKCEDSIQNEIIIYTEYLIAEPGYVCFIMDVKWIYDSNRKLRALEYIYCSEDERLDPNLKIPGINNRPVKLAP